MRKYLQVTSLLILFLPSVPLADDRFPTEETVRFVLNCMAELGGMQDENLYTCVCRHDATQALMLYSDYADARTYERNRAMPGKKGGFFRDNDHGKALYEQLAKVRATVNEQCVPVKRIQPPTLRPDPSDPA